MKVILRTRLTADKTRESQYQVVKKQVSMDDKKGIRGLLQRAG